jgi:hypothetical protein
MQIFTFLAHKLSCFFLQHFLVYLERFRPGLGLPCGFVFCGDRTVLVISWGASRPFADVDLTIKTSVIFYQ